MKERVNNTDSKLNMNCPFPVEALPPVLRALCEALNRESGIPPSLPAAIGLGLVAGAAAKSVGLASSPNLRTVAEFQKANKAIPPDPTIRVMEGAAFNLIVCDTGAASDIVDLLLDPFYLHQRSLYMISHMVAATEAQAAQARIKSQVALFRKLATFPDEASSEHLGKQVATLAKLLREQFLSINVDSEQLGRARARSSDRCLLLVWTKPKLIADRLQQAYAALLRAREKWKILAGGLEAGDAPDLFRTLPAGQYFLNSIACCRAACLSGLITPIIDSWLLTLVVRGGIGRGHRATARELLKLPAQKAWTAAIARILENRQHCSERVYYLPPQIHAVLVERAQASFKILQRSPARPKPEEILTTFFHILLTFHVLEDWERPEVSPRTAENAAALGRWLLGERESIVQALMSKTTAKSA